MSVGTCDWNITAMRDRFDLFFQHLLRPIALPFAGGISSAVVLFVIGVVPAYPLRTQDAFGAVRAQAASVDQDGADGPPGPGIDGSGCVHGDVLQAVAARARLAL